MENVNQQRKQSYNDVFTRPSVDHIRQPECHSYSNTGISMPRQPEFHSYSKTYSSSGIQEDGQIVVGSQTRPSYSQISGTRQHGCNEEPLLYQSSHLSERPKDQGTQEKDDRKISRYYISPEKETKNNPDKMNQFLIENGYFFRNKSESDTNTSLAMQTSSTGIPADDVNNEIENTRFSGKNSLCDQQTSHSMQSSSTGIPANMNTFTIENTGFYEYPSQSDSKTSQVKETSASNVAEDIGSRLTTVLARRRLSLAPSVIEADASSVGTETVGKKSDDRLSTIDQEVLVTREVPGTSPSAPPPSPTKPNFH